MTSEDIKQPFIIGLHHTTQHYTRPAPTALCWPKGPGVAYQRGVSLVRRNNVFILLKRLFLYMKIIFVSIIPMLLFYYLLSLLWVWVYISSHVIAIDIDVYSAFAVIFNILCLEVAYDSMRLFYWYLHYIYDLILYLCIIPCVILLVSFMQS